MISTVTNFTLWVWCSRIFKTKTLTLLKYNPYRFILSIARKVFCVLCCAGKWNMNEYILQTIDIVTKMTSLNSKHISHGIFWQVSHSNATTRWQHTNSNIALKTQITIYRRHTSLKFPFYFKSLLQTKDINTSSVSLKFSGHSVSDFKDIVWRVVSRRTITLDSKW